MADDKLWPWNLPTFTDRNSFFQDEYDDSLALAMAAVDNNICLLYTSDAADE